MKLYFLRLGVFLSLIKFSHQAANIHSPSYIGAVVEYHPVNEGDNDGQLIAEANANNYLTIIKTASQHNVDIIVFPETGLTNLPKDGDKPLKLNAIEFRAYYRDTASYIPSPNEAIILCNSSSKYKKSLQKISCAARDYKIYVVVNHHERADCPEPNCSPDDFLLYNTNVAFDRDGRVIARYRKYNLYHEEGTNATVQPEYSTFATDFGVSFGMFICADIIHEKPATFFVDNPNVTDVVFSTHWLDGLPFFDSVQQQAAWAYAADVNFLASAYSDELTASGGSGIYAGKSGPIRIYQPRETSNALTVAHVPKVDSKGQRNKDVRAVESFFHVFDEVQIPTITKQSFHLGLYSTFYHDDVMRLYTTWVLNPKQKSHITTICNRGLCCDFHVETTYDEDVAALPDSKQYTYRLAVFNGVRNLVNVTTAGFEICALVACAGDRIEDCGSLYPINVTVITPISFNKLIITRRANLDNRVLYQPSTLTTGRRRPFESEDFAYIASGHKNWSLLLMYLIRPRSDIMTFAIYGRRFDRDGEEVTISKTDINRSGLFLAAFVVILLACIPDWHGNN